MQYFIPAVIVTKPPCLFLFPEVQSFHLNASKVHSSAASALQASSGHDKHLRDLCSPNQTKDILYATL